MPSPVTLTIQFLPPSPNQTRGKHWSSIKRTREDAAWAVKKAYRDADLTIRRWATTPAVVDLEVHAHGVAGDPDNQWARCKPILDALVCEGLLVDDSPRWLRLGSVTHHKAPPRKGHIVLTITYHEEAS